MPNLCHTLRKTKNEQKTRVLGILRFPLLNIWEICPGVYSVFFYVFHFNYIFFSQMIKGPRVLKTGFGVERDFVPLLQGGCVSEKSSGVSALEAYLNSNTIINYNHHNLLPLKN